MTRASDKRNRLVIAADKLFREQGVTVTTLTNIADLSQVPLGNVSILVFLTTNGCNQL